MAKPWDDSLKKLVHADPQAFVNWIVADAHFTGERPYELKHWTLEGDALLEVKANRQDMLLQLEFQTSHDPEMDERLLRYNVLARSEHKIPVLSCVIYLLKDGEAPSSPLSWSLPNGQKVLEFHYQSIELADLSPGDLLQSDQPGLLPLLPLTKGGARREIVESMFSGLLAARKIELIPIGYTLASLAFSRENRAEQDWLLRRFHEMHDMLRETPIYQYIFIYSRVGELKADRRPILNVITHHFPKLARLAKKQVVIVEDPELLPQGPLKAHFVQSAEAQRELRALDEAGE